MGTPGPFTRCVQAIDINSNIRHRDVPCEKAFQCWNNLCATANPASDCNNPPFSTSPTFEPNYDDMNSLNPGVCAPRMARQQNVRAR